MTHTVPPAIGKPIHTYRVLKILSLVSFQKWQHQTSCCLSIQLFPFNFLCCRMVSARVSGYSGKLKYLPPLPIYGYCHFWCQIRVLSLFCIRPAPFVWKLQRGTTGKRFRTLKYDLYTFQNGLDSSVEIGLYGLIKRAPPGLFCASCLVEFVTVGGHDGHSLRRSLNEIAGGEEVY